MSELLKQFRCIQGRSDRLPTTFPWPWGKDEPQFDLIDDAGQTWWPNHEEVLAARTERAEAEVARLQQGGVPLRTKADKVRLAHCLLDEIARSGGEEEMAG
ncbi:MAG: hypothetical protein AB7I24_05555 [Candidatus Nanopelagicales bacterium]